MLEKVIGSFYRSRKHLISLIICIYETQINKIMKYCCYILAGNPNFPAFIEIKIFHIISWRKCFRLLPLTQNFNPLVFSLLFPNEFDKHNILVPRIKTLTTTKRHRISIIIYVSKWQKEPSTKRDSLKNLINCGAECLVSNLCLYYYLTTVYRYISYLTHSIFNI